MYHGSTAFYELAQLLVTNVFEELDESPAGVPERACVVPGEIAWDECDCGMLAVSPRAWNISDTFPDVAGFTGVQVTPCTLPWLVGTIEVQIIRCAPSPTNDALAVTCEALDAAAKILVVDAYLTLTETVRTLCQLKDDDEIVDYTLGEQLTVGPDGGCVGTTLTVQVAVPR